ncbi:MAG: 4,5-DOPA dioxygenase extradiol [Flavobacteriales bacterium]
MKRREFTSLLTLSTLGLSMTSLQQLSKWGSNFKTTKLIPVLFLGHGNPMNAIEENEFVAGFRKIATTLPEIQAILVVSAHWLTKGTAVTAMEMPRTIHDFGGFPQALFEQQYPAPGSPALAHEIVNLVSTHTIHEDHEWGLDHGTWTVLKHLYPKANIPVVQFSIDYQMSLEQHFALAQQLKALRNKGVLIIGSGNIVHNLRAVDFSRINEVGYGFDWAHESRAYVNEQIRTRNFQNLTSLASAPKALSYAVPTTDHYIPLLYSLGLAENKDAIELFNDELLAGSLSMTSLKIG